MKINKKTWGTAILSLGMAALSVTIAIEWMAPQASPQAAMNHDVCESIKPGINQYELHDILGRPVHHAKHRAEYYEYFDSHPISATQIHAIIDQDSGDVLMLHCGVEDEATWDIRQEPKESR